MGRMTRIRTQIGFDYVDGRASIMSDSKDERKVFSRARSSSLTKGIIVLYFSTSSPNQLTRCGHANDEASLILLFLMRTVHSPSSLSPVGVFILVYTTRLSDLAVALLVL